MNDGFRWLVAILAALLVIGAVGVRMHLMGSL